MPQDSNQSYPGAEDSWIEKMFNEEIAEDEFAKKLMGKHKLDLDLIKNCAPKQETYQDLEKQPKYLDMNQLAAEIYRNNMEKGFYEEPRSFGDRIALMHSELSEALEADRKDLMDDKLPHRTGIEVELADCLIRILDCSAYKGLDIHGAVLEKLAYNKTRPYKHGKKY